MLAGKILERPSCCLAEAARVVAEDNSDPRHPKKPRMDRVLKENETGIENDAGEDEKDGNR